MIVADARPMLNRLGARHGRRRGSRSDRGKQSVRAGIKASTDGCARDAVAISGWRDGNGALDVVAAMRAARPDIRIVC